MATVPLTTSDHHTRTHLLLGSSCLFIMNIFVHKEDVTGNWSQRWLVCLGLGPTWLCGGKQPMRGTTKTKVLSKQKYHCEKNTEPQQTGRERTEHQNCTYFTKFDREEVHLRASWRLPKHRSKGALKSKLWLSGWMQGGIVTCGHRPCTQTRQWGRFSLTDWQIGLNWSNSWP